MRYLITCLLLVTTYTFADSQERITSFKSDIIVNSDASIDVTENISVYANQDKIIHGIVRSLPINYTDSYKVKHHSAYDIQAILFNNNASPYHIKSQNNQFLIYIGDANTTLSPNNYLYTIRYHVNNAINFLKDGDELYWNITGNGWQFPIDSAEATITFPSNAKLINYTAYTGGVGSQGQHYTVNQLNDNQLHFQTTQTLAPGEGLTIAAAIEKNVIQLPGWYIIFAGFKFLPYILGIFTLLYFYLAWRLKGRDPAKGTIIPRFDPPRGLTAEALRFIKNMRFDKKTFTCAIVNMATEGYLKINYDDDYTLIKNKDANALADVEKRCGEKLFLDSNQILVSRKNYDKLDAAKSALKYALIEAYEKVYFVTNIAYFWVGVGLTILTFISALLLSEDVNQTFFMTIWLSAWTIACVFLILKTINSWKNAFRFIDYVGAIFFTVFTIPFVLADLLVMHTTHQQFPTFPLPMLIFLSLANLLFLFIIKQPTVEGRQLMDEIDGFKLFLSTTERFRLDRLNPPKQTPELFEKFLPYAIALDVENEWGQQFDGVMKSAGIEPSQYRPTWYSGNTNWGSAYVGMPLALSNAFGSALSSASTSSSASGGGGSSGGGGGGGGGGGW